MRTLQPDPYPAGYASGRELAAKVTDLTYHTEWLQVAELRIPDAVPLDVAGRHRWLHGYANGIRSVLDERVPVTAGERVAANLADFRSRPGVRQGECGDCGSEEALYDDEAGESFCPACAWGAS